MDATTKELIDHMRADNTRLRRVLVQIRTRCVANDRPQERLNFVYVMAKQALKTDVQTIIDRVAKAWKSEDGR